MEILLWLVPPIVVTAATAVWVGMLGRESGEVDREERARRLGAALERSTDRRYAAPTPEPDRSTGVAVRPSRRAGVERRAS